MFAKNDDTSSLKHNTNCEKKVSHISNDFEI